MILLLDKAPGETPLQAMERWRAGAPDRRDVPMVYAGRLDPMAEGLLLVLTGEDRHAVPDHLGHDKDYVATFLFGVASDTHDALGRLTVGAPPDAAACEHAVATLAGTHTLPLPAWSAYRVRGRPLHAWASEGRLGEIEVPARAMEVRAIADVRPVPLDATAASVGATARIARVRGAFRQEAARADWARLATARPPLHAVFALLTVTSGTYVRALAHALGERLGYGALLYALRRTRIGPYTMADVRGGAAR